MKQIQTLCRCIVLIAVMFVYSLYADKSFNERYYVSSDSVTGLLKKETSLSFEQMKQMLKQEYNLVLGADYHFVYFGSNNAMQEAHSSGGVIRFFGEWQLVNPNTNNKGSLVFKVENRHKFSDVAPFDFGTAIGYAGLLQSTYTDQGNRLTVLYWKQNYFDGRLTTYTGFLDSTEYLDIYLLISPWNAFGNLVFATGSATIAGMPDGALGVMGAYWLTQRAYIVGSIVDANGDPTKPMDGFDTFFHDFETLKTCEIGWTTAKEQLFFDNFHITLWQIDKRKIAQTSQGYGVSFSLTHTIDAQWFTFVRGGYGHNGGVVLRRSLSAGFGHFGFTPDDIYAIGVNWGEPNEEIYGENLTDQYTAEIFYRYQMSKHMQITPSIQLIKDPALYQEQSYAHVIGLRLEATF